MPGYQTKQERVAVVGVTDLLIRSLLDYSQFDDPRGEAERLGISSASWPLFGLLWPSGSHLAERIARRPVQATDRILELGCGLALASLVAHRRGADVTASDCHPLAEQFLLENLRLNDLLPMKYRHGHWGSAALRTPDSADPVRDRVCGRFELIMGSDLLYERGAGSGLADFIADHAAPAAEVWIVDPDRGNRPAFNRCMQVLGFALAQEPLHRPATLDAPAYKGRLLCYVRVP